MSSNRFDPEALERARASVGPTPEDDPEALRLLNLASARVRGHGWDSGLIMTVCFTAARYPAWAEYWAGLMGRVPGGMGMQSYMCNEFLRLMPMPAASESESGS